MIRSIQRNIYLASNKDLIKCDDLNVNLNISNDSFKLNKLIYQHNNQSTSNNNNNTSNSIYHLSRTTSTTNTTNNSGFCLGNQSEESINAPFYLNKTCKLIESDSLELISDFIDYNNKHTNSNSKNTNNHKITTKTTTNCKQQNANSTKSTHSNNATNSLTNYHIENNHQTNNSNNNSSHTNSNFINSTSTSNSNLNSSSTKNEVSILLVITDDNSLVNNTNNTNNCCNNNCNINNCCNNSCRTNSNNNNNNLNNTTQATKTNQNINNNNNSKTFTNNNNKKNTELQTQTPYEFINQIPKAKIYDSFNNINDEIQNSTIIKTSSTQGPSFSTTKNTTYATLTNGKNLLDIDNKNSDNNDDNDNESNLSSSFGLNHSYSNTSNNNSNIIYNSKRKKTRKSSSKRLNQQQQSLNKENLNRFNYFNSLCSTKKNFPGNSTASSLADTAKNNLNCPSVHSLINVYEDHLTMSKEGNKFEIKLGTSKSNKSHHHSQYQQSNTTTHHSCQQRHQANHKQDSFYPNRNGNMSSAHNKSLKTIMNVNLPCLDSYTTIGKCIGPPPPPPPPPPPIPPPPPMPHQQVHYHSNDELDMKRIISSSKQTNNSNYLAINNSKYKISDGQQQQHQQSSSTHQSKQNSLAVFLNSRKQQSKCSKKHDKNGCRNACFEIEVYNIYGLIRLIPSNHTRPILPPSHRPRQWLIKPPEFFHLYHRFNYFHDHSSQTYDNRAEKFPPTTTDDTDEPHSENHNNNNISLFFKPWSKIMYDSNHQSNNTNFLFTNINSGTDVDYLHVSSSADSMNINDFFHEKKLRNKYAKLRYLNENNGSFEYKRNSNLKNLHSNANNSNKGPNAASYTSNSHHLKKIKNINSIGGNANVCSDMADFVKLDNKSMSKYFKQEPVKLNSQKHHQQHRLNKLKSQFEYMGATTTTGANSTTVSFPTTNSISEDSTSNHSSGSSSPMSDDSSTLSSCSSSSSSLTNLESDLTEQESGSNSEWFDSDSMENRRRRSHKQVDVSSKLSKETVKMTTDTQDENEQDDDQNEEEDNENDDEPNEEHTFVMDDRKYHDEQENDDDDESSESNEENFLTKNFFQKLTRQDRIIFYEANGGMEETIKYEANLPQLPENEIDLLKLKNFKIENANHLLMSPTSTNSPTSNLRTQYIKKKDIGPGLKSLNQLNDLKNLSVIAEEDCIQSSRNSILENNSSTNITSSSDNLNVNIIKDTSMKQIFDNKFISHTSAECKDEKEQCNETKPQTETHADRDVQIKTTTSHTAPSPVFTQTNFINTNFIKPANSEASSSSITTLTSTVSNDSLCKMTNELLYKKSFNFSNKHLSESESQEIVTGSNNNTKVNNFTNESSSFEKEKTKNFIHYTDKKLANTSESLEDEIYDKDALIYI